MLIYIIYILSPLLVNFLFRISKTDVVHNKKAKRWYLLIIGIITFLMIGLRYYENGSGDSSYYYNNWIYMSSQSFSGLKTALSTIDLELGYLSTVWLLSHVFINPQFVFIFSGLFFAISVCRFLYYNSEDCVLGMLAFNCLGLFNFMAQGLRQGIAMCICLFAIEYCKKRKIVPTLLLIMLAMLFHASAASFVVVYFIYPLKLKIKNILILIVGYFAVIYIFMDKLLNIGNFLINDHYGYEKNVQDGTGAIAVAIYIVIIAFAAIFHYMYRRDDRALISKQRSFMFYLTMIGLFVFSLRLRMDAVVQRVSYYFAFGEIALLSLSVSEISEKEIRFIIRMCMVILCAVVGIHKATYTSLVPYLFFWQG